MSLHWAVLIGFGTVVYEVLRHNANITEKDDVSLK